MKKKSHRLTLAQQLTLITCICVLIPSLILSYSTISSMQETTIQTRQQQAQSRSSQLVAHAEQMAELCSMSTQVFLNTPNLVEHLTRLKAGQQMDTMELLDFFREDISSLEKIVLSNPNLYQIRVYSVAEDINEMMPILYSASRMEQMPWSGDALGSGTWYLDYENRLFREDSAVAHVMSFVTRITTAEAGTIGVVEVSARMDKVLPELFSGSEDGCSVLISEDGAVLAGMPSLEESTLRKVFLSGQEGVCRMDGKRAIVSRAWLKEYGCWYLQINSLADLDALVARQAALMVGVLVLAFAALSVAVSRLIRRLLRGFYGAFDGLRAFANGDIDATVQVTGEGEVADFAREASGLLEKIRHLMADNLARQLQTREMEIRALQNQINAHFIYNVLEAIKMMAEIDERYDIADAVTSLGKLLRYSMKWESGNVRLDRELDYIENYIALMNLRFDYVIRLDVDIPEELKAQKLPKISLQPIVENAVVHGAAVLAADTTIVIRAEIDREAERYAISIRDEGKGMDGQMLKHLLRQINGQETAATSSGNGIGLHNVHERIRRSFGPAFGLNVTSRPGEGTTVTVTLPLQRKEESEIA
ncbi:MAG: sensor histidine kinase [Candidatus Ventricola sp.]